MFSSFFYLLRKRGISVSFNEWMTLMEALQKGLHHSSFTGFYYMCRAILVKSETDFDRFDGAFLEYFKDMEFTEELPKELLDWLGNPKDKPKDTFDMDRAMQNQYLSSEEIQKMLLERLQEQKEEHNGGSYWVGTGGVSVFGNSGYSPKGIRVGGVSHYKTAFQVAGERNFRDFRNDNTLDTRQFQVAFRQLREFSSRIDAPKTEFDVDNTIKETCNNAGKLKVVYQKYNKDNDYLLKLYEGWVSSSDNYDSDIIKAYVYDGYYNSTAEAEFLVNHKVALRHDEHVSAFFGNLGVKCERDAGALASEFGLCGIPAD